jgi:hypothetical protein
MIAVLGGCSVVRSQQADEAQTKMIGISKEKLLACMGPPKNRMTQGATEVWSYGSGGSVNDNGRIKYCSINFVMSQGRVSQVSYSGPSGDLIAPHEECAFALQNCLSD